MGKLKYLMIHCSATPEGRAVTPQAIEGWHKNPPPNGHGWDKVGYQKLYLLDGSVYNWIVPDDDELVDPWEVTYGAGSLNAIAFHWCYVGGLSKLMAPKDTRTDKQKENMAEDVKLFILKHPNILVCPHSAFAAKACPSFDVAQWCEEIGIDEKNIYRKGK